MTIQVTSVCNDSTIQRTLTLEQALRDLHGRQFKFGGKVIEIGSVALVVRTPMFGPVDVVTYTGSGMEMRPLIRAAWCFLLLDANFNTYMQQKLLDASQSLEAMVADITLDKAFTSSIFERLQHRPTASSRAQTILEDWSAGAYKGALALILATGVRDLREIGALLGLALDDFYACITEAMREKRSAFDVAQEYEYVTAKAA